MRKHLLRYSALVIGVAVCCFLLIAAGGCGTAPVATGGSATEGSSATSAETLQATTISDAPTTSGGGIDVSATVKPITATAQNIVPGDYSKVIYNFAIVEELPENVVQNLADLDSKVTVIALVKAVSSQLVPSQNSTSADVVPRGHALATLTVQKVYKSDGAIAEGKSIKVDEWYFARPAPYDKSVLLFDCVSQCLPMSIDGEYVLFLTKSNRPEADYQIFSNWRGQFKVSQDILSAAKVSDLSREQLGVGPDKNQDPAYWAVAQEVKDKYLTSK